jgi:hypothetical protein
MCIGSESQAPVPFMIGFHLGEDENEPSFIEGSEQSDESSPSSAAENAGDIHSVEQQRGLVERPCVLVLSPKRPCHLLNLHS